MIQKSSIFDLIKHLSVQELCSFGLEELEFLSQALMSEKEKLDNEKKELNKRLRRNSLTINWLQGVVLLKSKKGGLNGK